MKNLGKHLKTALATIAIVGSLGFGAAQAFDSSALGSKQVNVLTGCPVKPGCMYGGQKIGCCVIE